MNIPDCLQRHDIVRYAFNTCTAGKAGGKGSIRAPHDGYPHCNSLTIVVEGRVSYTENDVGYEDIRVIG